MYDVIVIGGGPAGITAALRASELGAQVALVERNRLGGVCALDGCVPTRTLAKAARLLRNAEQFADFGIDSDPPVLDLPKLLSLTQDTVYRIQEKKQLIQHLQNSGVSVYEGVGSAKFIDSQTISLEGEIQLQANKFILCTGGHALRLDFPGAEYALTHSDMWRLKAQPRSIVILGAADTGCQLASIFSAFGTKVTLLGRNQRILAGEDEVISQTIRRTFQQRGVHIVTGIVPDLRIEKLEDGLAFYYRLGEVIHAIKTEAVVMAVGWRGNAEGLDLSVAGVEVDKGYIRVDDTLQTTAPNIYAAGDITGRMMLVQSAVSEAHAAAENAVLGGNQPYKHLIVPHGGFTDPEYGSVGLTEVEARAIHDCAAVVVPYAHMDRAVIDRHTEGFCKLIASRETHRILGAHVVGEQALEIVQLAAGGMAADMWVEQLADLEIAYPTYTAIIGLAARRLVQELGVRPMAPEWRALGKPHAAEWERSGDV